MAVSCACANINRSFRLMNTFYRLLLLTQNRKRVALHATESPRVLHTGLRPYFKVPLNLLGHGMSVGAGVNVQAVRNTFGLAPKSQP